MKEFNIPVTWEVGGVTRVKAHTLDEAVLRIERNEFLLPDINGVVDGSTEVNYELVEELNPGHNLSSEKSSPTYIFDEQREEKEPVFTDISGRRIMWNSYDPHIRD